jgi:hypothetical protein
MIHQRELKKEQSIENPTRSFSPTIEGAYSTNIIGTSQFNIIRNNKKIIKLFV